MDNMVRHSLLVVAGAPHLRSLIIQAESGAAAISGGVLAQAGMLRHLTSLAVANICPPLETAELDALFAGLPALRTCSLRFCFPEMIDHDDEDWHPVTFPLFPATALRCTALTSLAFVVWRTQPLLDCRGLPDGISALSRLASLSMANCLSEPLTPAISCLAALTRLDAIWGGDLIWPEEPLALLPLPPPALVALRVKSPYWVTSLAACHSLSELTVVGTDGTTAADLQQLASLTALTKLRLSAVYHGSPADADWLPALAACTALQDLRLDTNNIEAVPMLPCFGQLTYLDLAGNCLQALPPAAGEMTRLQFLDLSYQAPNGLELVPEDVAVVRRLTNLRAVGFACLNCMTLEQVAILLSIQRAAHWVSWLLNAKAILDMGMEDDFEDLCEYIGG